MKFKITSITQDKKQLIQYYDNITQQLWSEKKIPLFLCEDPRTINFTYNYQYPNKATGRSKSNFVKHLRIQLGLNCNYHCSYCNQRHDRNKLQTVSMPNETMVRNFINSLKRNNIQTNRITLWGGEPLVYIKLLKILVPQLRQLYPDARITTVSNGSLLNNEIVDWLVDNKIQFTMSHDGWAFNSYRDDKDPLDDPKIIEAINRYINNADPQLDFSFHAVITPDNCNFTDLDHYFESKIGRKVRWHVEGVVKCDKTSVNVVKQFDNVNTQALLRHTLIAGTSPVNNEFYSVRDRVSKLIGYLVNEVNANDVPYSCDNGDSDTLAVDLQGNIVSCHGSDPHTNTVGNIDRLNNVDMTSHIVTWNQRERCPSCPFLINCRGACDVTDEQDNQIACDMQKIWQLGLYMSAWILLFNATIIKIEPTDEI